jgi:hypothetical protein
VKDVDSTSPDANTAEIRPEVADLLASAGFARDFSLHPIAGGRNNRVFRLETGGRRLLLKWYFSHPRDNRNRLQSEFSFYRFLWNRGVRVVPQPIAYLSGKQIALYDFVEGRRLSADEIGLRHIDATLDFYHAVNRHRADPDAAGLPLASEACFQIKDHLKCLGHRLASLEQIDPLTETHRAARDFVTNSLVPCSRMVLERAEKQADDWGIALDIELEITQRCLSPSDFGFHNAMIDGNKKVFFIDFEYAGWDDPAKLICDFFCQPEIPAPHEFLSAFTESVLSLMSRPDVHRRRVQLLLPVYQLKWCSILLNEFLPTGIARRQFGAGTVDRELLESQLEKARQSISQVSAWITEADY